MKHNIGSYWNGWNGWNGWHIGTEVGTHEYPTSGSFLGGKRFFGYPSWLEIKKTGFWGTEVDWHDQRE